jgi:hypothetical protein
MHRLTINRYHSRLRVHPVKSDKTLKIWLNTMGLIALDIDTKLHETRRVQLMKLKVEPFQHTNNKRV